MNSKKLKNKIKSDLEFLEAYIRELKRYSQTEKYNMCKVSCRTIAQSAMLLFDSFDDLQKQLKREDIIERQEQEKKKDKNKIT